MRRARGPMVLLVGLGLACGTAEAPVPAEEGPAGGSAQATSAPLDGGFSATSPQPSGSGADGGVSCTGLRADYAAALSAAVLCSPGAIEGECTARRPGTLPCGCPVAVNESATPVLDRLAARWKALGCKALCLPIACPYEVTATCSPMGVCAGTR